MKREALLGSTERLLEPIRTATRRRQNPLRGEQEIALRVGKVTNKHKMAKHFELTITETSFSFARREQQIQAEASMDGFYVVRSSVDEKRMNSEEVVGTSKA